MSPPQLELMATTAKVFTYLFYGHRSSLYQS